MYSLTKVLLVDDERLIRQGIIHYIDWTEKGFELIGEASNGKQALQLISENKPDIIITDIVMPVMNGIDFIEKVKKLYPEIGIIVLSSYGDFDYVRNTFKSGVTDYILKPELSSDHLLQALERVVAKTQTRSTHASVDETKVMRSQMKKFLAGYELEDKDKLWIDYFNQTHFAFVEVHYQLEEHFDLIVEPMLNLFENVNYIIYEKTNSFCQLVINIAEETFHALLREIKAENEDRSTRWLISSLVTDREKLKDAFQEQLRLIKHYQFYLKEQRVFYYDSLPQSITPEEAFDLNYFTELLKDKKFESAFYLLNTYLNEVQTYYAYEPDHFKNFLGNIIFNITVLLKTLNYDTDQFERDKYHYFNTINNAKSFDEAIESFNHFIDTVQTTIALKEKEGRNRNIDQLLKYIDEHYSEPLSLTMLAEHFHFNPSYLSSYFSLNYQIGFSEYLTQVRINKAKELLANKKLAISEIGGMVGYADHSYFCKVFKKNTNKSPSRYRKDVIK